MTLRTNLTVKETLMAVKCCNCGIYFGMTETLYEQRNKDGGPFFCPNGHSQFYTRHRDMEKELEVLRKKEAQMQAEMMLLQSELKYSNNLLRGARAAKTRLENRVKKGVCPCCNRSFVQLARHMASKHPDYAGQEGKE